MKKKDIITVVVSLVVMIGCFYFLYTMLFPTKKDTNNAETAQAQTQEFTGNIDNETLNQVEKLNDYGEAPLDNIGRVNPFGPFQ